MICTPIASGCISFPRAILCEIEERGSLKLPVVSIVVMHGSFTALVIRVPREVIARAQHLAVK